MSNTEWSLPTASPEPGEGCIAGPNEAPAITANAANSTPSSGDNENTRTSTTPDVPQPAEYTFPWKPPTIEELDEMRRTAFTDEERARAWSEAAEAVKTFSDESIRRWNAEIDTYLVYAGLFSAILTAFNVQSYQLLQPDPQDATLTALQQISLQLTSFSTNPSFVNSTHPAFQKAGSSPAPRAAVWLNALWFSSLILSLSSASLGIMVKQWLNEYSSGISPTTTRETARLRQYRLNSLIKWRVGDVVTAIPVLLQLALACFLAGLLVLLWTIHPTVATVASILVGVLTAITVTTTLLPLVRPDCAYLSPQTFLLYAVWQWIPYYLRAGRYMIFKPLAGWLQRRLSFTNRHTLRPSTRRFLEKMLRVCRACRGFGPRRFQTWRGRERVAVHDLEIGRRLDADMLVTAYDTTMNLGKLSTVAACLSELDAQTVIRCFWMLNQVHLAHFSAGYSHLTMRYINPDINLWVHCMISMLVVPASARDEHWSETVRQLSDYIPFTIGDNPLRLYPDLVDDPQRADWIATALSSIIWHYTSPPPLPYITAFMYDALGGYLAQDDLPSDIVVRHVAGALHKQLLAHEVPEDLERVESNVRPIFLFLSSACRLLLKSPSVSDADREAVRASVVDVLQRVTLSLRDLDGEYIPYVPKPSSTNYVETIGKLVDALVQVQTTLGPLLPDDLLSTLGHAIATHEAQGLGEDANRILEVAKIHLERLRRPDCDQNQSK